VSDRGDVSDTIVTNSGGSTEAVKEEKGKAKEKEAAVALRAINLKSREEIPLSEYPWFDSTLHYHLIADGFASQSTESPYKHWLYKLRPKLNQVGAYILCRGFSYSEPGYNYSPRFTREINFPLADHWLRKYAPDKYWSTTYHAFSIAGPLFVCGLATLVKSEATRQNFGGKTLSLILTQPAFLLAKPVAEAVHYKGVIKSPPECIHSLAISSLKFWKLPYDDSDPAEGLLEDIEVALSTLTSIMPVHMVFWRGDRFIAYPQQLVNRIINTGVVAHPLQLEFPLTLRRRNSFLKHAHVARHRRVLREIKNIIARQLATQQGVAEVES
jgi:hypothetical protein